MPASGAHVTLELGLEKSCRDIEQWILSDIMGLIAQRAPLIIMHHCSHFFLYQWFPKR